MFSVRSTSKITFIAFVLLVCSLISAGNANANPVSAVPVSTEGIGDTSALDDSARPKPDQMLHISMNLKTAPINEIDAYVALLSEPGSPIFHHWLTPLQFGEKFGASQADVTSIVSYLKSNGIADIKVWPNHVTISAAVSRSEAERIFGVTIHGYDRSPAQIRSGLSASYYAADQQPKVDASIAGKLLSISGLSTKHQLLPTIVKAPDQSEIGIYGSLDPPDLAQAYDISTLHDNGLEGEGETIDIFSPTAYETTDISSFFTLEGLPMPTINVESVDGGTTDLAGQDEACLDIETIGGQAPDATINVVEGPFGTDLYQQIATDDPEVSSESWGDFEDDEDQSYADTYEALHATIAAEGVSMFVAAGDWGAYDPNTGAVSVNIEASSPSVTGVGGTELLPFNNGNWNGEVAWTYSDGTADAGWGGGGGLSVFYDEPTWQTGPGVANTSSNGFRQVPDISACASSPYYDVFTEGAFNAYLGTSASCPLWASAMALIDEGRGSSQGNIDPSLYKFGAAAKTPYHDITSGNDGVYYCTPNWDFVTGWGSADFEELYTAFGGRVSTAPPTILDTAPTSASVNGKAFTIKIYGSHFTSASTATYNNIPLKTNYVSAGELTATIKAAQLRVAASYPIVVNTVYGTSNTYLFNVQSPTSTKVSASINPTVYGQSTVLSAYVYPSKATGEVEFSAFTTSGVSTISGGVATFTATGIPVGNWNVAATYEGNGINGGSTSATLLVTVRKESASLTIASSANPVASGTSITLTSTLTSVSPGLAPFEGDFVQFFDGKTLLGYGEVAVNSKTSLATASLTVSKLAKGTHKIRAQFEGDSYTTYETSPTIVEVVD